MLEKGIEKLSLSMPLRHKDGDEESSTLSQPRQQMEASEQLHISTILSPRKAALLRFE